MKKTLIAMVLGLSLLGATPSIAHAATPKPGQFCSKADRGVKKAGLVCSKDKNNSRYSRWR